MGGYELNSVEQYDPERNEWYKMASMETKRMKHRAVTFNGSIYLIGMLF